MIEDMSNRLHRIVKATVAGADVALTRALPVDEAFAGVDCIEPPHDPEALCNIFEHSNALRQNVDAYATNIDGFGHRLEPVIDFAAEDADACVADSMADDSAETGVGMLGRRRVRVRRAELEALAKSERRRLQAFFEASCLDHSFVDLRRRTRQDLEVTGNAYWEVLRDSRGRLARLVHVPAHTVRLMPLDAVPTAMTERMRMSTTEFETVPVQRRLRRYVQKQGLGRVFFKSLGDPRHINRHTGEVMGTSAGMGADVEASEMIHFAIHSPRSAYGVPRWIGTLLSVLGSREMEEVNYMYFSNKSVPPLALCVSGGKLNPSSVPRIENFIAENLRGKNNFHKILILEAESDGVGERSNTRIEFKPLTEAQQKDALFQQYDERNIDKVGASFRLPRILRGESKDFNRAVADAQMRFCEDQVFQPERDEFDWFINHRLLPDMGIRMWRFRSQSPITRDPERLTDSVEKLVRVGVLTPEEGRMLAADVFNREFKKIGDDWTKRPITLTLAGIQTGVGDVQDAPTPKPMRKQRLLASAKELIALRDELRAYEVRVAKRRMQKLRDGGAT